VFRPPREANILFAVLGCKSGASLTADGKPSHTIETIEVSIRELLTHVGGTP